MAGQINRRRNVWIDCWEINGAELSTAVHERVEALAIAPMPCGEISHKRNPPRLHHPLGPAPSPPPARPPPIDPGGLS